MTRWRAIVFDLDDTLYPEHDYVQSGLRAVAVWAQGELGLPAERSYEELCRSFAEGAGGDTFDRWLAGHQGARGEGRGARGEQRGARGEQRGAVSSLRSSLFALDSGLSTSRSGLVAAMVEVYRRHQPQIALKPEVSQLLKRLGRLYRLGLLTDGYLEVQRRKVAALNLRPSFQVIVYSDALGRDAWKPSPRPFELVLRRLSVAGGEAVYVADNPAKDFRGARQVGMATIRIRRPDGLYRHLEPASAEDAPDVEVADLGNLFEEVLLAVSSKQ